MQDREFWAVKERNWEAIKTLVKSLNVSPLAAQLLVNRGIESAAAARAFFETPFESLISLVKIPGCAKAVSVIKQSIAADEKIVIFGDYDADGVTATALMVKGLRAVGANVDYYIPDRFSEGYDLNEAFVRWASDQGYKLLITVDCGIKAFDCVNLAKETGIKIIISDHHEPFDVVPEADVIINPKLNDDFYVKDLAGVGVALALIASLWKDCNVEIDCENFYELLELAAIGTVADSVPLVGCNRTIVRHGLDKLGNTSNLGLGALFEVEGLKDKKDFEVTDISFKIAPCINAVGRLGDANDAVELLISDSPQEAWDLAKKLHRENAVRQNLDGAIFLEALEEVERDIDVDQEKVVVLASDNWHPGVIGITAARLVQRLNMPVVLISVEDGIGKGSGRSLGNFDLNEAFKYCSEILLKYGGHKLAGGFSIEAENIPAFRKRINDYARNCSETRLCLGEVDGEVLLQDIDFSVIEEIDSFKPFGPGNPAPLFVCRNVHIVSARLVGKKNEHLKLTVGAEGKAVDCIGFKMVEKASTLKQGDYADIVFSPQINTWNGTTKLQLLLSDIKPRKKQVGNFDNTVTTTAVTAAAREKSDFRMLLKGLTKGRRIQYLNMDANEKILLALSYLKNAGIKVVVLFPLQSMASDFEKSVLEEYPGLRISRIDCVTSNENIEKTAGFAADGSLDLVITSLGTWLAKQELQAAFEDSNACMCIYMGHWGKMYPGENFLYEAELALSQWEKGALIFGSGQYLSSQDLFSRFGVTEILGENNFVESNPIFRPSENKLEVLGNICSDFEKNLVFVNTSSEAVAVSQEMRSKYNKSPYMIRSYYGGLVGSQKKLILEDFNYGLASVLVASRNSEPYRIKHTDCLIIHSFPLNIFDFNRFLIAPCVYLIYNSADLVKSLAYVHSLCPNDDLLQYAANNIKHSGSSTASKLLQRMSRSIQEKKVFGRRALSIIQSIIFDMFLLNCRRGSIEIDSMKGSWRYIEAAKEIEAFQMLAKNLGVELQEAAAALDSSY